MLLLVTQEATFSGAARLMLAQPFYFSAGSRFCFIQALSMWASLSCCGLIEIDWSMSARAADQSGLGGIV